MGEGKHANRPLCQTGGGELGIDGFLIPSPIPMGETFYEGCQVLRKLFQAAWRIFCRVMFAR